MMVADSASRGPAEVVEGANAFCGKIQDIPWIGTPSPEYASKRKTYNLDNAATPYAIACPRHARDVAALVRHSIDSDIPITVRSGGHDLFGRCIAHSALCIDMRAIDFVEIAPDKKSARIGGGIRFGKLMEDLSREGLSTPFGSVPSIGYVGWASLGGYGALSGQWGLGVDQIIGAEVVDANGNVVQADEEMLKGIRGAGGNFGVVVEIQIKLYELKTLLAGLIVLDSSTKGVAKTFADFMTDFQSFHASGQCPPPASVQPGIVNHPQTGQTVLITFVWSSSDHPRGKQFLEKLLTLAPVAMENVAETSVPDWLKVLEAFCPYGVVGGGKGMSFRQLTPKVLTIIGRHLAKMPSDPATAFYVHQLSRSSPSATDVDLRARSCFNPEARQEHFVLELIGTTLDQSRLPQSQKWIKNMYDELKASGEAMDGSYISVTPPEDTCLDKIYGGEWEGLLDLKRKLDPEGVFKNAVPRMLIG